MCGDRSQLRGKPVADGPEVRVLRSGESGPGTRYRCFVCPIVESENGSSWTMHAELLVGAAGAEAIARAREEAVEN